MGAASSASGGRSRLAEPVQRAQSRLGLEGRTRTTSGPSSDLTSIVLVHADGQSRPGSAAMPDGRKGAEFADRAQAGGTRVRYGLSAAVLGPGCVLENHNFGTI
jgi:hypothetical protein